MILHEVTVENFRGYRAPVTVKLDGAFAAVITGRNGSGKSTLLEAALRALADRHDVGGKEAVRIRPRGTALAPRVTLVFEHAGQVYRITKQFLDSPSARLERRARAGFELVEEGRSADQRVRDMLRSDAAGRGLAGTEDTGILQALCSPQGGLALPGLSGKIVEDIRAMLGAQLAGSRGAAFEAEVVKRFEKAWSARGPRKSEAIHQLRADLAKAQAEAERCRAGLVQVEQYEQTAARERQRHAALLVELRQVDLALTKADQDAARVNALRARHDAASISEKLAAAEYERLAKLIERIAQANESKRKLVQARPEIEKAVETATAAFESAKEQAAIAQARLNAVSGPDLQFDSLCRMSDEAAEFNTATAQLRELRKKISRVEELCQLRDRMDAETAALNAPGPEIWKKIQVAAGKREEARVHLDALALRVAVTAETGLEIEVENGQPAGRMIVGAGSGIELSGQGEVRFRMPGMAGFRISGPAGDAAVWGKRLASAGEQVEALTAAFGTDNLEELERRLDARNSLDSKRINIEAELTALLGRASRELLVAQSNQLAESIRIRLGEFPEWETNPPDASALKAEREARRSERDAAAREARRAWQNAEAQRSAAELALSKALGASDRNRQDLGKLEAELGTLTADGKPPEQREQELFRRRRECESAESELSEIGRELALLPADSVERAAALHERCGKLQDEAGRAERSCAAAEAGARALLEHGPYEVLSNAEERVAELERMCAGEEYRLDAIRKLHQTLQAAKERALNGLTEPVAASATQILSRIAGRPFAEIRLGQELGAGAVMPGGGDGASGIDQLSGGEQEQVYLATRLALADILTRDEPHTIVLDDVLLNTDDERLGRILELVAERNDRMRFLILTCHPERYARLENARQIRLDNFEVRD